MLRTSTVQGENCDGRLDAAEREEVRQFLEHRIRLGQKVVRGLQAVASSSQRAAGRCAAQQRALREALRNLDQDAKTMAYRCAPELGHVRVAAGLLDPVRVEARCSVRVEGPGVVDGAGAPADAWTASFDLMDSPASEEVAAVRYLLYLLQRSKRTGTGSAATVPNKGNEKKKTRKQMQKQRSREAPTTPQASSGNHPQNLCKSIGKTVFVTAPRTSKSAISSNASQQSNKKNSVAKTQRISSQAAFGKKPLKHPAVTDMDDLCDIIDECDKSDDLDLFDISDDTDHMMDPSDLWDEYNGNDDLDFLDISFY